MRKKLFLLIFVFFAVINGASAKEPEWVKIGEVTGVVKSFIDRNNITKNGLNIQFWYLLDEYKSNSGSYSAKSLAELDCNHSSYTDLTIIHYENHMGEGMPLQVSGKQDSVIIPPGSVMDSIKNYVCSIK